jgi:hypothetical protein
MARARKRQQHSYQHTLFHFLYSLIEDQAKG